jgi:hypothetical protein
MAMMKVLKSGGKLKVSGYPSVVVYSPAGEQLTKIPEGLSAENLLRF